MVTAATLPEAKLRTMLSESASLQAWVGAASAAAALASIHVGYLDVADLGEGTLVSARPFVLIGPMGYSLTRQAGGYQNVPAPDGSIQVLFEANAGEGDSAAEILGFHATCVNVMHDVWNLSGVSDHLSVVATSLLRPPMRSVPEEGDTDGDYLEAGWLVRWNPV